MYQALVEALFPAYVIGCFIALAMSWSKRSFYLAFGYAYLLIVFQFIATGQAKGWGAYTFLYCAYVQMVMGLCGMFGGNKPLAALSAGAIILNMIAAICFTLHHPIRQIYFVGVNVIQTLQILSLIAMSPAAVRLSRLIREKRTSPWMVRAASGIR